MPRQHVPWNESGFLLPLPDSKAIQIHLCIAKDIGKSLLKGGRKLSSISPFSLTLCLSGGKKTSSHSWGRSEGRGGTWEGPWAPAPGPAAPGSRFLGPRRGHRDQADPLRQGSAGSQEARPALPRIPLPNPDLSVQAQPERPAGDRPGPRECGRETRSSPTLDCPPGMEASPELPPGLSGSACRAFPRGNASSRGLLPDQPRPGQPFRSVPSLCPR